MYPTSLRHSVSVVQKPSGVAVRLLSYIPGRVKIGKAGSFGGVEIPGLPPKENTSKRSATNTGTSGTTSATPSDTKVVNNRAGIDRYARRLGRHEAGQSPATLYPERTRSFRPGLSWLGDDEFESTGLAFRLARHHMQRVAASKSTRGSGSNKNANSGSGPRRDDGKIRTRAKASGNAGHKALQPKKNLTQKSQPRRVDVAGPKTPKTIKPGVSTGPYKASLTPKPSPVPQMPAHVDIESTDFTSLFGASPSLPATPSLASMKTTPTDDASRRVQLTLEYQGGDYSRLVSNILVTSQGNPLVYAERTMARRRELGPNGRNGALGIVRGMIGRSQDSQPTA